MKLILLNILKQVDLEGFYQVAEYNALFSILVSIIFILFSMLVIFFKKYENMLKQNNLLQKKLTTTIDDLRKEAQEKEERRLKEWKESEEELAEVLNGVSKVLEISERKKEFDTKEIINQIKIIKMLLNERLK